MPRFASLSAMITRKASEPTGDNIIGPLLYSTIVIDIIPFCNCFPIASDAPKPLEAIAPTISASVSDKVTLCSKKPSRPTRQAVFTPGMFVKSVNSTFNSSISFSFSPLFISEGYTSSVFDSGSVPLVTKKCSFSIVVSEAGCSLWSTSFRLATLPSSSSAHNAPCSRRASTGVLIVVSGIVSG